MKKTIILISLLAAVQAQAAQEYSKRNLTERALTLKQGEILVGGAVGYGKTNSEDDWMVVPFAAYGITDDLTLEPGGLRYRFIDRPNDNAGLELTVGGGVKGLYERKVNNEEKDVLGYGMDLTGQYVLTPDFAITFGLDYVFWNDVGPNNKKEYIYSVGTKYQVMENVTLITAASYHDLKDMTQDDAYSITAGVNYSYSPQMDIGFGVNYTDFDPEKEGFKYDGAYEKTAVAYVSYRF